MSKRTLRRAAERQARKAENKSQLTAQAAVAEPAAPILALENELADGAPENQPSLECPPLSCQRAIQVPPESEKPLGDTPD
jgi:hypothetical protein